MSQPRIKDFTKKSAGIPIEYNGEPLSLDDKFPIGYLAGSTVREAIMYDPSMVSRYFDQGKVSLKGDAIKLMVHVRAAKDHKGFSSKGF